MDICVYLATKVIVIIGYVLMSGEKIWNADGISIHSKGVPWDSGQHLCSSIPTLATLLFSQLEHDWSNVLVPVKRILYKLYAYIFAATVHERPTYEHDGQIIIVYHLSSVRKHTDEVVSVPLTSCQITIFNLTCSFMMDFDRVR